MEEHKKNDAPNDVQKITKDMIIADVIEKYPYLAKHIMEYGVHCVSCGIADMETLEEGFIGHGATDEDVAGVIYELNKVVLEHEKG